MAQTPVLHVIVIGFHHKKGCQVEFSYPPLMPGVNSTSATTLNTDTAPADEDDSAVNAGSDSTDCPTGWKYLPTLGLPDGSHNFAADSVFFNLPSLVERNETVFGVSCYRQIPVDKLKIRTADVTRSTVQKSVCILAAIPVYGYIEVKLSLIAQSYFDQGDFARTGILVTAYHQLNACLRDASALALHQHHFVGLPLRDIMLRWRYKALILFKLMLLQKRVVCFGSPVRPVCALILAIASLHAQLLEDGCGQAACVRTSRPMSPMPTFQDSEGNAGGGGDSGAVEIVVAGRDEVGNRTEATAEDNDNDRPQHVLQENHRFQRNGGELLQRISVDKAHIAVDDGDGSAGSGGSGGSGDNIDNVSMESNYSSGSVTAIGIDDPNQNTDASETSSTTTRTLSAAVAAVAATTGQTALDGGTAKQRGSLPRDASVDVLSNRLQPLCTTSPHLWSAPYPIYTAGNLCLPYLSLPYMDLLSDASVRGYTIGTSNILFQQKKQLADVFVDVEAGTIETAHPDVRRQLQLTTEDLRFVDFVLRHVQAPRESAEGSESWIRSQFQGYMLALLRTAMQQQQQQSTNVPNSSTDVDANAAAAAAAAAAASTVPPPVTKDAEHFNAFFIAELLQTAGWREWTESMAIDGVLQQCFEDDVAVGHPFAGTLSVADMKLKLAQTMNNSESGRKLNQAVNTTSKAVGGAILQAKGALSNWWSAMTTAPPTPPPPTTTSTETTDSTPVVGTEPANCAHLVPIVEAHQTVTGAGIVEIGREVAAGVVGDRSADTSRPMPGGVFTV